MPTKKKALKVPEISNDEPMVVITPTPEQAQDMIETVDELVKSITCTHRNRHAAGVILCVLDKGHEGNHTDGVSEWSNEAGFPNAKAKV